MTISKQSISKTLLSLTVVMVIGIIGYALVDTLQHRAEDKPSEQTGAPQEVPLLAQGTVATNFILLDLKGKEYGLYEYQNKKWVIVEFFASWCPHCQHSVPVLNQLYKKHKNQLEILSINTGDHAPQKSTSAEFQKQFNVQFPILEEPPEKLIKDYSVQSFPTMYLVDKAGVIQWSHKGTLTPEDAKVLEGKLK